nr:exodeoxyribonuclease III [Rhodothalassium salexigens]
MHPMRIATFNINGVKARLPRLQEWLADDPADLVCLQEIKSVDDNVPRAAFEDAGWHVATHGQKGFNGVAMLSRQPLDDVMTGLPGDDADTQARYMEATLGGVRVASIYLPNGNPVGTEKFDYKLAWMRRLTARAKELLATERPVVLSGDFNVIPAPEDAHDPAVWADDALYQPESRAAFRALVHLGFTDAVRLVQPHGPAYTFWDYQRGAWQQDHGIRIDHHLLSPQAADRLTDARIDRTPRAKEKASDHTPVIITLADP